ncbi:DNA-binding transcriptional regulator, ArsR family [Zhouia amylolytica]|uniref:DNA-binding transcriptional regulator, ArsR family n=2 Tax=Zhouia amylolytica TaxID=376730 RepID=A0A1I6PCK2_9FLAO|nr:metalloregulator ArsR/SmtB family transcription factor [Zhouia amylolytica]ETN94294.1 putative transcriptional regulator [Zhouia amylolytica AD3]MCQ0111413.1 winged helix-turn-helix transcriptional regulator [Zhouia amylolytica]SFS37825.1 DNA-binding transcriptional regulator, ArsR family [Zhouia amylolytica]
MGFTKRVIHTIEQNELAKVFKALSHPARVAIMEFISENPGCICAEMVQDMELAQSTISQHLNELKAADLLEGEVKGKKMCYTINFDKWYETKQAINDYFMRTSK